MSELTASQDVPVSTAGVDVVIVNWNAGPLLARCIAALQLAEQSVLASVTVVDNASADNSIQGIAKTPVKLLENSDNKGFGAACNQGAALGHAPQLLFLNPDTEIAPQALGRASAYLAEHPECGVVGLQLVGADGDVQRSCARLPTVWSMLAHGLGLDRIMPATGYAMREWDHQTSRRVDHVIGACYLIRRDLFATLGGFDERFFVYLEDLDLSQRVRQQGFDLQFIADASGYHLGGGTSAAVPGLRLFYSLRARLQYSAKHFSRLASTAIAVTTLVLEPAIRLLELLLTGRRHQVPALAQAYRKLWRWRLQC
ncbi:MAG: glycosyltransferase family 2 protein [Pseudomonadales bacterium]